LNDLAQGLQLAEVLLGDPVPLVGLGDRAVAHKCGEWHGNVVPQKEPYFLPPIHGFRHGDVKIRIDMHGDPHST
jgi:hypothetical protein